MKIFHNVLGQGMRKFLIVLAFDSMQIEQLFNILALVYRCAWIFRWKKYTKQTLSKLLCNKKLKNFHTATYSLKAEKMCIFSALKAFTIWLLRPGHVFAVSRLYANEYTRFTISYIS